MLAQPTAGFRSRGSFPAVLGMVLVVSSTYLVETSAAAEEPDDQLGTWFAGLADHFGGLDWDREYEFITRAVHNVWARNGWDEEADRFARDLITEVAAIPPWEFRKRFDLFSRRVGERYHLSPGQIEQFRFLVTREMGGLLARHSGVILEQAVEGFQARAAKRPFTPEQVARWTKAGDPLFQDAHKSFDHVAEKLSSSLSPSQRRIWDRDLAAATKRWNDLETARGRWAQGGWRADDWGLQDDPIQERAGRQGDFGLSETVQTLRGQSDSHQAAVVSRWRAYDPSTWFAYLMDFQKRYRLDPGQMSAARSIHGELVDRAVAYAKTHAEHLKDVPEDERATHEAYAPIRTHFAELQARLEAIPTTAQREQISP